VFTVGGGKRDGSGGCPRRFRAAAAAAAQVPEPVRQELDKQIEITEPRSSKLMLDALIKRDRTRNDTGLKEIFSHLEYSQEEPLAEFDGRRTTQEKSQQETSRAETKTNTQKGTNAKFRSNHHADDESI
jgi:hypothetical protein